MQTAILTIGDELLDGSVTDTNAAWLGEFLADHGLRCGEIRTIADDLTAIETALRQLAEGHDLCLVCGGLGPTDDDRTMDAVARAADDQLAFDADVWAMIETRYGDRPIPENNRKQAMVPQRATVLPSDVGTAPAVQLSIGHCEVFVMPGVPSEMRWHTRRYLSPYLRKKVKDPLKTTTLRFTGVGESDLALLISGLSFPTDVTVSYCTRSPENHVILRSGESSSIEEAATLIANAAGSCFVGRDHVGIPESVLASLQSRALTLGTAESCTGGLIGAEITRCAGASSVFTGSIVSYSNEVKIQRLGVDEALITSHGAVSEPVAAQMALGLHKAVGCDIGLSVTGIAGPGGGSPEKPVGTVCFGWSGPDWHETETKRFRGDREQVRRRAVAFALDKIRRRYVR
ncbi:MAG: CinA family nicotinamide mononucleotide deamidase-related protein [Bradymonadia bacterium]